MCMVHQISWYVLSFCSVKQKEEVDAHYLSKNQVTFSGRLMWALDFRYSGFKNLSLLQIYKTNSSSSEELISVLLSVFCC